MHYQPSDGKWQVSGKAQLLIELRQKMTAEQYNAEKTALQEFLCGYFSVGDCNQALGDTISPLKATPNGGKVLKVRWGCLDVAKAAACCWS